MRCLSLAAAWPAIVSRSGILRPRLCRASSLISTSAILSRLPHAWACRGPRGDLRCGNLGWRAHYGDRGLHQASPRQLSPPVLLEQDARTSRGLTGRGAPEAAGIGFMDENHSTKNNSPLDDHLVWFRRHLIGERIVGLFRGGDRPFCKGDRENVLAPRCRPPVFTRHARHAADIDLLARRRCEEVDVRRTVETVGTRFRQNSSHLG